MSTFYSEGELLKVKRMREEGYTFKEIARELPGRTHRALSTLLRRQADYQERFREIGLVNKEINSRALAEQRWERESVRRQEIPECVAIDRDRRANEPRTLTMELFGDPPPSRSALGRPCQ